MKKFIIPSVILIVIIIVFIANIGPSKLKIEYNDAFSKYTLPNNIELKVYLENSGSMDAYMCNGSQLKDAVYDYVSNLSRITKSKTSLNYINSQIIPHSGNLDSFIKNMNPQSFQFAGGNRSNTDLPQIFRLILSKHKSNSISIFISDCILDIPEGAKEFFGQCQISVRNSFISALDSVPTLGVEIIKLESLYSGQYFYSNGCETLQNVIRPYYIWVIGDRNILSKINEDEPIQNIIHGIKEKCAFTKAHNVNFKMQFSTGNTISSIPSSNKMKAFMYIDLKTTLQDMHNNVKLSSNPSKLNIKSMNKIEGNNQYSHVIEIDILDPLQISADSIVLKREYIPDWVEKANDDTGVDIKKNIKKTTGIKYLIQGVADAYKNDLLYTSCKFNFEQI